MDPYFLLLTNLSATAAQAARCAAVLGGPLHVRLALLHLYHDALLDPELLAVTTAPAYRSQAGAAAALRVLAARLPAPAKVEVTTAELPEALAGAVHRYHPLLLPVRPRSFLGRLFHRSVTARVLAACPVPVLLLPTTAAPAEGESDVPAGRWPR